MMKIEYLRKEIDNTDNELLQLIAKRLYLAEEIAQIKQKHNLPFEDKKREDELINARIKKMKELGLDDEGFVKQLFALLMEKSKSIQKETMEKR